MFLRLFLLGFILWFGLDMLWFYRGWKVVPPQCVRQASPSRILYWDGQMTPMLAQALLDYMSKLENPAAMRISHDHQVEVRPALYLWIDLSFSQFLKGAVAALEDDDEAAPFQSDPIYCDKLEPYLVPLPEGEIRDLNQNTMKFWIYVFLARPSNESLEAIAESY